MGLPYINTREDLNAITGTPEHAAFMALLAGTLWRLEKDATAQAWVAIEDNSTIERFNFTRADFPDAQPPTLPEYGSEVVVAPDYSALRAQAYRDESDPLFFKEQRGEVPPGTWLAKVAEIKARWPE